MTQYSGKIIRKNPVVPTQTSASGVWTTEDAAAAVRSNTWPVAGVPDPISRSVRLRSSASAYLNRTFTTPTSNTKWTFSGWLKRGTLGSATTNTILGSALGGASTYFVLWFSADSLAVLQVTSGATVANLITTQVFRDPSAWYHITMVWDSGNATSSSRILLYVNGVQVTSFSTATYPSLNLACSFNASGTNVIGYRNYASDLYFDGYMTEINFIDGQALTPSSFGTTDSTTGAWIPMPYTGTYGANGFYLNFKDNSSTGALGLDYSGNGNNWTTNNISLTAGTTYDSMVDVPTLWGAYNTSGDTGALFRGNYATWNPLGDSVGNAPITLSNANLTATNGAASYLGALGTIALPSSGKYYWEGQLTSTSSGSNIWTFGIAPSNIPLTGNQTNFSGSSSWYIGSNEQIQPGGVATSAVAGTTSDVYQICFDAATGNVFLGKNNTFYSSTGAATGNPATGANPSMTLTAGDFGLIPWTFGYAIGGNVNFGQRPFTYTPPTGYKTLNTFNLPDPTIVDGGEYFNAVTYSGNNGTQSITGVGFAPDWVWIKVRNEVNSHYLFDQLRGADQALFSDSTSAEIDYSATGRMTSFDSDGFTVKYSSSTGTNASGDTYVAWNWKANGAGVSNTDGSITSTVSANPTAGFSIVTYTGTGANATVGHGLGVAPRMIIVKNRSASESWRVYHASIGNTGSLNLSGTDATITNSNRWNNTSPTSSVFTVGTDSAVNNSGNSLVAYCFSEVVGYSKFGSYTGNGSTNGPFVYCGFRPRFVMIKSTATANSWHMTDTSRSIYNQAVETVWANETSVESTSSTQAIDILSNGFKIRNSTSEVNNSGTSLIYMAFAENPFKNSNAR